MRRGEGEALVGAKEFVYGADKLHHRVLEMWKRNATSRAEIRELALPAKPSPAAMASMASQFYGGGGTSRSSVFDDVSQRGRPVPGKPEVEQGGVAGSRAHVEFSGIAVSTLWFDVVGKGTDEIKIGSSRL